ncbi:MAG: hypothetical protein HRU69_11360 [Flammeovirgaceae bacterium]|nr:MAG: hypothetical protein HRU69_11360 [Flammeovirgaceae bacterium]
MKKVIFMSLLTLTFVESLACACTTISKYDDYTTSDFVFIGTVTDVNNVFFEIRAHEFFKGQSSDTLVANIDDCSIVPEKGEIWLFYAVKTDDNRIYVSQCGSSRSFRRPFSFNMNNFPKPPPPNVDEGLLKVMNELNKDRALAELHHDISSLRVKKIQTDLQNANEDLLEVKGQVRLLIVGLCFCIVLTGILGVIIYRKVRRNH